MCVDSERQQVRNEDTGDTRTNKEKTRLLSVKNVSLFALVLQQVGLVLMIRHSRTRKSESDFVPYLTSTAVVLAECLKLVLNLSLELLLVQHDTSPSLWTELMDQEGLNLVVPALLYLIQNNLLFVALSNLSVPVYQVTNQGKLLTTALCSRILLNKSISGMQYVSLAVLALGVALVQLSGMEEKISSNDNSAGKDQNQLQGLIAVVISCITSGFAGVYFEKVLKSKSTKKLSVYIRNAQLSIWSIFLGLIPVFANDMRAIQENGFFQGYNIVVVGVIACQAMTGLIVALVMKYADSILKGFATSVAVVVATALSIFIWQVRVDKFFLFGAAMVLWAVRLYTMSPVRLSTAQDTAASRSRYSALKCLVIFSFAHHNLSWSNYATTGLLKSISKVTSTTAPTTVPTATPTSKPTLKPTIPVITEASKPRAIQISFPDDSPIASLGRCPGKRNARREVKYVRDRQEIVQKKTSRACTKSLDVYAWLMDQTNSRNETMMITYGGLIHVLREREFVFPNGAYIDDDFDTWVTPTNFRNIVNLEPVVWQKFGWTLRIYQNCNSHTIFGQLVSACGHMYQERPSKAKQDHPAIELYILQELTNTSGIVRDLWQGGGNIPKQLIYPQQHLPFSSSGTNATLNIQIPRYSEEILTCIYGNWSVPSSKHAGVKNRADCLSAAVASTVQEQ